MTGKSGLLRQLGSAEIVAQVALARRFRPVKKVVFMGMGEPAHNLDNVLDAIDLLGTDGGIGHKNQFDPPELVELGEAYARLVDYPIQYQWTLLKGINDTQNEMDGIIRLLRGKFAIMNVIPYNSLDDDEFQRPEADRIHQIMRYLHENGVLTKVRNSAGQDIDGGCGQLRARAERVIRARQRPAESPVLDAN